MHSQVIAAANDYYIGRNGSDLKTTYKGQEMKEQGMWAGNFWVTGKLKFIQYGSVVKELLAL